ncbi:MULTISPECIES: hypothetical protein [Micromonospora]|nr:MULTISPECIES: hypothetical protein [Micromonospora]MCX5116996.1 hypothetical protein [Micromonospora sp. NBC_00362]WTI10882.1 hypothetical protein OHB44_14880 [Micromonospora sp. NBC_00821]
MSRRVRTDARWCLLSAGTPLQITAKTRAYRPSRRNEPGWRD